MVLVDVFWNWLGQAPTLLFFFLIPAITCILQICTIILFFGKEAYYEDASILQEIKRWRPEELIAEFTADAFIEEFLFRLAPFFLTIWLWGDSILPITIAVLASSAFFGLIHNVPLKHKIFNQGIAGILLCIVFLKCGGLSGNLFLGLLSSTITHTLMNLAAVFIIIKKNI